jgi:hypothetical protein
MVSEQNDTASLMTYSGAAWSTTGPVYGPLTSWTPTVGQAGGVTVTTTRAVYSRVGRRITGEALVSVTGSGTAANNITITVPVAMAAATANTIIGEGWVFDTSAGFFYYGIMMWTSSTTANFLIRTNGSGPTYLGTTSMTAGLAVGDLISCVFSYEASADA